MSAVVQSAGTKPPKISKARLTHKRFRDGKKKGTTFRFSLSAAATVRIEIIALSTGHPVVTLTANRRKGKGRLHFSGRWATGKLAPGRYKAVITATNSGGTSRPVTRRFRVLK
jgi:hypothetical protein